MNFEACLALPRDPREAAVIADNLEALGRALRHWPDEAWRKLATTPSDRPDGLFERLAMRTAEAALDARQRTQALESAEATAAVLRVLWPETTAARPEVVEVGEVTAQAH
jgi:hypothetical protein